MKMKINYNNFINQICDLLSNSDDEIVKEGAFTIGIGLDILSSYLKDIATLAIERNDEELLKICKSLCIVTEEGE